VGVPEGPLVTSVGEVIVCYPPGYSSMLDLTRRSDAACLGSVSEHRERVPLEDNDGLSTARDRDGARWRLPPPEAPGVAHVGDFDRFTSMHAQLVRRCRRKDLEATSDGALTDLVRSCHDAHVPLCDVCSEHEAAQPTAVAGPAVDRPSRGPPPQPGGPDRAGGSSLAGLTASFAAASSDATSRAAAAVVHQGWAAKSLRYSASGLPAAVEPPVEAATPRTAPPLTGAEPPQEAAAEAPGACPAAEGSSGATSHEKRLASDGGALPEQPNAAGQQAASGQPFWAAGADLPLTPSKTARLHTPARPQASTGVSFGRVAHALATGVAAPSAVAQGI